MSQISGFQLKKGTILYLLALTIAFAVLALFINQAWPSKWIGISGLLVGSLLISIRISSFQQFINSIKLVRGKRPLYYLALSLFIGALLAIIYNLTFTDYLIPIKLGSFALIAASIGTIEELIFRGFIQTEGFKISPSFGIIFAAFSHSIYKTCLFLFPVSNYEFNPLYMFLLTFGTGLLLGIITWKSKSIFPAIAGHAVFDIVVYGALNEAPWWVW